MCHQILLLNCKFTPDTVTWGPFVHSATMQGLYFSVVNPTVWNKLPSDPRHPSHCVCSQFHQLLETVFSAWTGLGASLSWEGALYKF